MPKNPVKPARPRPKPSARAALTFINYRIRKTWLELSDAEKKQAKAFRADIEAAEKHGGLELIDVVERGKLAYEFLLWRPGSGVLLAGDKSSVVADVVQHAFTARKPNRVLRERMAAAFNEAKKPLGIRESVEFKPDAKELFTPSSPEPRSVESLDWNHVEQEHAHAIAALVKHAPDDPAAMTKLAELLDDATVVGGDLLGEVTLGGRVAALVLAALPKNAATANDIQHAERELLARIAARPELFTFDVGYELQERRWPGTPLELARWLGTAQP